MDTGQGSESGAREGEQTTARVPGALSAEQRERVRARHRPLMDEDAGGNRFAAGCIECDSDAWPCPTLSDLDG